MNTIAKTLVATGCSSGLGFELIKQLLAQNQPYKFILGARDTKSVSASFAALNYDSKKHDLSIFPLDLFDLKNVKIFAAQTLDKLDKGKLDCLLLNAGMVKPDDGTGNGPHGSKWSEQYVVNHLSQHYLIHLLNEKLVESKSRIVFVSSGAIRQVKDTKTLEHDVRAGSGTGAFDLYGSTKFIQLLNAHYWRRELKGSCEVLAVSPGMIPGTGLGRHIEFKLTMDMPDAKPVPEGAQNILRAVDVKTSEFPEDPEQIFLTSWGEWWGKDVYGLSLDKGLQDKWSASKEEIELENGL